MLTCLVPCLLLLCQLCAAQPTPSAAPRSPTRQQAAAPASSRDSAATRPREGHHSTAGGRPSGTSRPAAASTRHRHPTQFHNSSQACSGVWVPSSALALQVGVRFLCHMSCMHQEGAAIILLYRTLFLARAAHSHVTATSLQYKA